MAHLNLIKVFGYFKAIMLKLNTNVTLHEKRLGFIKITFLRVLLNAFILNSDLGNDLLNNTTILSPEQHFLPTHKSQPCENPLRDHIPTPNIAM